MSSSSQISVAQVLQTDGADGLALTSLSLSEIFLRLGNYFTLRNNIYHFSGVPTQSDWEAWRVYTASIAELNISIPDPVIISDRSWVRVAQMLDASDSFLPNLKRAKIYNPHVRPLIQFQFMLSPTLESLEIHGLEDEDVRTLATFLSIHASHVPLKHVTLHNVELLQTAFEALPNCQQLQILDIQSTGSLIGIDWIRFLMMAKLQTLKVQTKHQFPAYLPPDGYDCLQDRSPLNSIELVGPIPLLDAIVNAAWVQGASVQTLKLEIHGGVDEDLFTPLMATIVSGQSQNLLSLSMKFAFDELAPQALVANLTYFPHLRNLELPFQVIADPDSFIANVILPARAWSNLQHLSLANGLFPIDARKLTPEQVLSRSVSLSGLKVIAKACPNLRYLQVLLNPPNPSFDDGPCLPDSGEFTSYILFHGLQTLAIGSRHPALPTTVPVDPGFDDYYLEEHSDFRLNSEVINPFVRYLYAMFPHATIQPQEGWDTNLWKTVAEIVILCRAFSNDIREVDRTRQALENLDGRE